MGTWTDRGYLPGLVLFAFAVALGLAAISIMAGLEGRIGQMFTEDLPASLIILAAFVIVGAVAGLAMRRGNEVGFCALLGGIGVVAVLYFLGYRGEQEGLEKHAWTGAALSKGLFVCAGIPGSLIGSLIGGAIGLAIVRSRNEHSYNTHDSQNRVEPGGFADRPRD